ncbi:hypothetical protein [Paracoccus endophyticus]|uniref:hypothetical protein n=1 Tax=Paracoccus endophyticus TaxID=2233774 RepID=UPI0013A70599|nr:hypothetical protein [Paracoccus endophyticus]
MAWKLPITLPAFAWRQPESRSAKPSHPTGASSISDLAEPFPVSRPRRVPHPKPAKHPEALQKMN